jgi:hypothetical protein
MIGNRTATNGSLIRNLSLDLSSNDFAFELRNEVFWGVAGKEILTLDSPVEPITAPVGSWA